MPLPLSIYVTNCRSMLNEVTARFWTDAQIITWINEGARDLARRTETLQSYTYTTNIYAGLNVYQAPANLIRIDRMEFIVNGQTYMVTPSTQNEMDQFWGTNQFTTSSYPEFFVMWGSPGGQAGTPNAFTDGVGNGTGVFTSATGSPAAADVGCLITIASATANGAPIVTTVQSVVVGGSWTLANSVTVPVGIGYTFIIYRGPLTGIGKDLQQTFKLYPIPSQNGTLNIFYYRLPTQTTTTTDYIEVPEGWEDLVVAYVEYKARRVDKDPNWQYAKQEYEEKLQDLINVSRVYHDQMQFISSMSGTPIPWDLYSDGW